MLLKSLPCTVQLTQDSEDARHGLKEVASLDIVLEGEQKKGISVSLLFRSVGSFRETPADEQYYHPLRYFTVKRPMGIEYFGEIEIEEGKCIHGECRPPKLWHASSCSTVRCHKASATAKATFHALDTRPSEEGGAVFKTGEALGWFDY